MEVSKMTVTEVVRNPTHGDDNEQVVIHRVLDRLGTPKNLARTVAKKVWDNQYRVNIYCTDETPNPVRTVSITDSFFVTLSGSEIDSKPTITRKYR
jgi:hypothetical protein